MVVLGDRVLVVNRNPVLEGGRLVASVTTLRDRTERDFGGRMAFIGLTWTFGKGPARPEQFDFAAPQTGQ